MENELYSIGIDIGTTTTNVVFSHIKIKNTAGWFQLPDIRIVDKQVLYTSPVYFTPLLGTDKVDLEAVKNIIENEFVQSNMNKKDISIGAVIITGESARKENAQTVIDTLSNFAGDFVVAAAGPDLEAVLSGYGAGASAISKEYSKKLINFDIGGGTTNACIFDSGDVINSFALDIGGRLIKFGMDGKVEYISEKIRPLINALALPLHYGERPSFEVLEKLTGVLSVMFLELCGCMPLRDITRKLFITEGTEIALPDHVTFSGGVSEYIYSECEITTLSEATKYNDIGPLLGYSIRKTFEKSTLKVLPSKEKIRATVIGAGNYSMKISGSTVFYDEGILPLKNIPVVRAACNESKDISILCESMTHSFSLYGNSPIALAFRGPQNPAYQDIRNLADQLIRLFEAVSNPIIIIVENDFAKALGLTIKIRMKAPRPVICIDRINVGNGDYIDLGKAVFGAIPVTVKTLIFK